MASFCSLGLAVSEELGYKQTNTQTHWHPIALEEGYIPKHTQEINSFRFGEGFETFNGVKIKEEIQDDDVEILDVKPTDLTGQHFIILTPSSLKGGCMNFSKTRLETSNWFGVLVFN